MSNFNFNPYADPSYSFTEEGVRLAGAGKCCFIFESGPFHTKDASVVVDTKTLVEGRDFVYILPFKNATNRTALRVAYGIYVYGGDDVTVSATLIGIGDRYATDPLVIKEKIKDKTLPELFELDYDDLVANNVVPAVKVLFSSDEWYGEVELRKQIDVLNNAILARDPDDSILLSLLRHTIDYAETLVNHPSIVSHMNLNGNAHDYTPEEIGARRVNGNAADSAGLFGYSKEELISYIISTQPDNNALLAKITKSGGTAKKLTMSDELSLMSSKDFLIDGYGGQFSMVGDGVAKFGDSSDILTVMLGTRTLVINNFDNTIKLDGVELVTSHNIERIAGENSEVIADIKTQNTATVEWVGDGSTETPLVPSITDASKETFGFGLVKDVPVRDSTDASSPLAAYNVKNELEKSLPIDISFCGRKLADSPTITYKNIPGLTNISNLSDMELPISDLAEEELSRYSLIGHGHDQSELQIELATDKKRGLFTYGPNNAINATQFNTPYRELTSDQTHSAKSIEVDGLNQIIVNEGDFEPIVGVLASGYNLTIPDIDIYYKGTKRLIPGGVLDLTSLSVVANKYIYMMLDLETTTLRPVEAVKSEDIVIGWAYVDKFGIRSHLIESVRVENESGTNISHQKTSVRAHTFELGQAFLNLENVVNLPPVYEPVSESKGYATVLSVSKMFSRHNSTFQFLLDLDDTILSHITADTFEEYISKTFLVRQFVQSTPSNIPKENITFSVLGGNSVRVYGWLPADGFVGNEDATRPNPAYPIGSKYYTIVNENPQSYLGGVWEPVVTLDIPEELRRYYNGEIGTIVELVGIKIPKNQYYDYVLLLPDVDYNGDMAKEIILSDGREGIEINYPGSPLHGSVYPYTHNASNIKTHVLLSKTKGVLTPLVDPKYVWIRVE